MLKRCYKVFRRRWAPFDLIFSIILCILPDSLFFLTFYIYLTPHLLYNWEPHLLYNCINGTRGFGQRPMSLRRPRPWDPKISAGIHGFSMIVNIHAISGPHLLYNSKTRPKGFGQRPISLRGPRPQDPKISTGIHGFSMIFNIRISVVRIYYIIV